MGEVRAVLSELAAGETVAATTLMTDRHEEASLPALEPAAQSLVRLAALLAIGASTPSLEAAVDSARAHGTSRQELLAVLLAIAPVIGLGRVVADAPRLATALGYDLSRDE